MPDGVQVVVLRRGLLLDLVGWHYLCTASFAVCALLRVRGHHNSLHKFASFEGSLC